MRVESRLGVVLFFVSRDEHATKPYRRGRWIETRR